jgi:hypothetical protein
MFVERLVRRITASASTMMVATVLLLLRALQSDTVPASIRIAWVPVFSLKSQARTTLATPALSPTAEHPEIWSLSKVEALAIPAAIPFSNARIFPLRINRRATGGFVVAANMPLPTPGVEVEIV